jgi:hypothetical protein
VQLPEDIAYALSDGVVLCHFINQIRPRAVQSIHVPSQAVVRISSKYFNQTKQFLLFTSRNFHWLNVDEMLRILLKLVVVLV